MSEIDPQVEAIGLLADPVRRALYEFVASADDYVGRQEAADAVGVARTLAAYHLDLLAEGGLLEVAFKRLSGRQGPGAGRTAKVYRRSSREIDVSIPSRRYSLMGDLLATAIERVPEAMRTEILAETGRRARAQLAASDQPGLVMPELFVALANHGYEPVAVDGEIRLRNCPFHALAEHHRDVICRINVEMIAGLTAETDHDGYEAVLEPRPGWCCVVVRPVGDQVGKGA
ncbi:MAG: helix-turn-helix transcriptional regulator [Actinomycetota bacterium]